MKILFISSRFPYPLLQGDRLICYHRLRTLSQKHEITLITFYQSRCELDYLDRIAPFCKNIYPIYLPRWHSLWNCIRHSSTARLPLQISYYLSPKFQAKIQQVLAREHFDVAHYFLLRMAEYNVGNKLPKIVEIIDSMQLNLESRLPLESWPKRWLLTEELKRIRTYENRLDRQFKKIVVVGKKDAEYLAIAQQQIAVIPNGIDTNLFKPLSSPAPVGDETIDSIFAGKMGYAPNIHNGIDTNLFKPLSSPAPISDETIDLIFAGKMSYAPNIHAVRWFVDNCWGSIERQLPNVRLIIAGADPPPDILKLGRCHKIEVTGYVDSMVDTLNTAQIAIAPMQSGSGMQNKILEAMSCALPVITTSIGLGSIEATIGKEILVANTPQEFIDTTLALAIDRHKIADIGARARCFVERNHSWETGADRLASIYQQIS